ncbi:MAG: hypothetical protein H7Y27_11285 [Gemmatimonadaceae bacterium]|nr:hypothetical protein [Chitinophagaceae bacterium]
MMHDYLNGAPCGYFSFNDESILLSVNDMLCRLTDYKRDELTGKNIEFILTLPSRIFYQTHLFPLLKMRGRAEEIFLTILGRDKTALAVLLNAVKNEEDGKPVYQCAFITVPNRKKFEDELVAARNKAERALKENSDLLRIRFELQEQAAQLDAQLALVKKHNQELIQLNRVVTHEMQEPLRKISMFSEMLTEEKFAAFDKDNARKRLANASIQMRTVVSGLQQFFWLEEAGDKKVNVDLNKLIRVVALDVEAGTSKDSISISADTLSGLYANPEQMKMLFYELLCNSVRFAKDGRRADVVVTTTEIQRNSFRQIPGHYNYESYIKIDVADNGNGFDPQYAPRVFDLFVRLQSNTGGRGIGLALCKKIVENHGGFISIDSALEKGTTVSILLPVHNDLLSPKSDHLL